MKTAELKIKMVLKISSLIMLAAFSSCKKDSDEAFVNTNVSTPAVPNVPDTDLLAPVHSPIPTSVSGLSTSLVWTSSSTLEASASWSAASDDVQVTGYMVYLSADANSYANPIVSYSTANLSVTFETTILDPALRAGSTLYVHVIAKDQDDNSSVAVIGNGFFIDTLAPTVNANAAYIAINAFGFNFQLSGVCESGLDVVLNYSGMENLGVLPAAIACENNSYNLTIPMAYNSYLDGMVITVNQEDVNNNLNSSIVNLASQLDLPILLQ